MTGSTLSPAALDKATTQPSENEAPATLVVVEASRRFGDVQALDNVSLALARGEVLALLGPSGCGKTTLMRSIAGLETLDSGSMCIRGRSMRSVPPQDRAVAMVFQDGALFPHLSARDNIAIALTRGRLSRRRKRAVEGQIRSVAEMLQIESLLDRYPHQLSGGQRQRVGIARAFVAQPALLLMDEPFANLDADLRVEFRREVRRLHALGVLPDTVFVTHDQTEALGIADRIAVMFSGQVRQVGTPSELLDSPATLEVARFLGVPRVNVVPARAFTLVVRPTDVQPVNADLMGISLEGTIVAAEPFAGGWLVTVHMPSGLEVEAVVPWEARPQPGDDVSLACRAEKVHVFDQAGVRVEVARSMVEELWATL